jgi:hypothetical protein
MRTYNTPNPTCIDRPHVPPALEVAKCVHEIMLRICARPWIGRCSFKNENKICLNGEWRGGEESCLSGELYSGAEKKTTYENRDTHKN